MIDFYSFLFCFNYLKSITIEILIFICSLSGLITLYFEKENIQWKAFGLSMEFCYLYFNCAYLVILLVIIIPIIYYRIKEIININYHRCCLYSSIACILTSTAGILTTIILSPVLLYNIPYNDICRILLVCLLFFFWVFLVFLTISDYLRIKLKIKGSYVEYLTAMKIVLKESAIEFQEAKINNDKKDKSQNKKNKNNKNNKMKSESAVEMKNNDFANIAKNMKENGNNINNLEKGV